MTTTQTITRRARAPQPLLRRYRPELQQLVATAVVLGMASPLWAGPSEFKIRRDKRAGAGGKAHVWGIYLTVGRATEGKILSVIAHELAHLLPWNHVDQHGIVFRQTLRALVKVNWPGIAPWAEGDRYDDEADCYAEDGRIAAAIDGWLADRGRP